MSFLDISSRFKFSSVDVSKIWQSPPPQWLKVSLYLRGRVLGFSPGDRLFLLRSLYEGSLEYPENLLKISAGKGQTNGLRRWNSQINLIAFKLFINISTVQSLSSEVSQLDKCFLPFYGTRRLITAVSEAVHWRNGIKGSSTVFRDVTSLCQLPSLPVIFQFLKMKYVPPKRRQTSRRVYTTLHTIR
jgi:hypothetical protein